MTESDQNLVPFDSFTSVYKILVWAGYSKPIYKTSRCKMVFHSIYRPFAFLIALTYNVQHVIFTVQVSNDVDKFLDSLMIVIPNMTLIMKIPILQLQDSRFDKVYELLKGKIFAATDETDAQILKCNSLKMNRIARVLNYGISFMSLFWIGSFYCKRYFDRSEVIHSYVPFRTDTWTNYSFSVLLECGPILWIGYGHISSDILVATFYAQAQTQLKIIKYQLTQLYNDTGSQDMSDLDFQYKDMIDAKVHQRLVQIVTRYKNLVWYVNEIDSIFNYSLSFQFLAATSGVCLVIYRMTVVSITSFPFIFLALLFCIQLTQVFLYCYFGNLVEFESRSINDSLYSCDWVSLSPAFRRSLLIAMTRWSQPIRPRVCGIIPLSLSTFVQILKSSYTLYTVLEASKSIIIEE